MRDARKRGTLICLITGSDNFDHPVTGLSARLLLVKWPFSPCNAYVSRGEMF